MIANWVIQLVISYIIRQLDSFGAATDWAALKKDFELQVDALLPAWAQALVNPVIDDAVDVLKAALADTADLQTVLVALASKDWQAALATLEALLQKATHPKAGDVLAALHGLKP